MSDAQRYVPITATLRDKARTAPNSWLPVQAPGMDEDGSVLPDAVIGRYRVDDQGRITDDFVPNGRYRPIPVPPVTPEMRETARSRPDGSIEVLDPGYAQPVVMGRYPVDAAGGIVEDFQLAEDYRPSPLALGWPAPRCEVEAAMQLAHIGSLAKDEVVLAVLDATLVLPADPARGVREHLVLRKDDNVSIVDAFVAADAVPADWPQHWQEFTGTEIAVLLDGLPGPTDLLLYGSPDLQVRIRGDVLAEALRTLVTQP